MLINEIIKGIKEAPQGLNRKEKTKDDIVDGSRVSINGRSYEWDKTTNAWYSHNDKDYVRPGSESDYRLTLYALKMISPQSKFTLNPFKLAKDLVAKPVAKRLGLRGLGVHTRNDPKASAMKKTGTVIGGAIGRGLDKIAGTGSFANKRRAKFDAPNQNTNLDEPNTFNEPKPKKSNVVNLNKKRKKSSILMPGDPDFRK